MGKQQSLNTFFKSAFLILSLGLFFSVSTIAQVDNFNTYYIESDRNSTKIPFILSGNQIIIKVEINGSKPLNFILDSGVKTPIIIDVPTVDTLELRNSKRTTVQGLGEGDGIEAIIATDNKVRIGNKVVNNNQTVLVLMEDLFHLSNKLGLPINGIMGYDLFRDFIIEINYDSHYLRLHNPESFNSRKRRRYVTKDLEFYKDKPYVVLNAELGDTIVPVKLLVDTGGSDALWLFVDSNEAIKEPEKFIPDFLGSGLSGDIFGKRSRISGLYIGKYHLKDITVSYPDSASVAYVMMHRERNGSIGGAALSRFKVIVDYTNKKISFKRGGNYRRPFNYNMSGLEIKMPFDYLPIYEVSSVREDSPAERAGVKVGDQLVSINGDKTTGLKFPELMQNFREHEGKKIRLELNRNGERIKLSFRLKKDI